MKFLVVFLVLGLAFAENPGVGELANNNIQLHYNERRMDNVNTLLSNPAMHHFYDQYYTRPQETQHLQIIDLLNRVENNKNLISGHKFPYANQISVDPNTVKRLISLEPRTKLINTIDTRTKDLSAIDSNNALKKATYERLYGEIRNDAAQKRDAALMSTMRDTEARLHASKLRNAPEHTYTSPFLGANNNMDKVLDTIRNMEKEVRSPLSPMKPNAIEITAMNRLAEKLEQISQRIHTKPLDDLHQDAHAQDIMLDRASNLIRSMSQNVAANKQNDFLSAVHTLLHKNHLHDHKFLSSLENEIMYAVANHKPLNTPRVYNSLNEATGAVLSNPVTNAVKSNAVTGAATNAIKNTAATATSGVTTAASSATGAAASVASGVTGSDEAPTYTQTAMGVSNRMRDYGRDMIARSKELERRADIMENRQVVPVAERARLSRHIQNRLVNPPTQVHALGSYRPNEF